MAEINTNNINDLLTAGIKAEQMKQQAIANNIANLETPGYRRIDIRFQELLSRALEKGDNVDTKELGEIYRPDDTPVKPNGNNVSLEKEVGQMVKNTLNHMTYVRLLNKKYQQILAAIDVK
jgi:flagellar basal-body rod protein FlgB